MSSRDRAFLATHHVVLECQPITLFLNVLECQPIMLLLILRPSKMFLTAALLLTAEASLGSACGADCGAATASGKEEISIFTTPHLRYVMSANSSSLSFTPLMYLAGMLWKFLLVLALFSRPPPEFVVYCVIFLE